MPLTGWDAFECPLFGFAVWDEAGPLVSVEDVEASSEPGAAGVAAFSAHLLPVPEVLCHHRREHRINVGAAHWVIAEAAEPLAADRTGAEVVG